MNGAVLTVGTRPELLDRQGQPGRAVGNDQPWCGESAGGEVAPELEPVVLGLARPETYGNQRALADPTATGYGPKTPAITGAR
ncbi:MAG TPA: hypothetical protein VIX82_13270 [Solirubrobacteraceae bacterium]